jgi:AraC-like DNA-binding protein
LLPSSSSLNFCQVEVDPSGQIWVSNGSKFLFCFKIHNLFKRTIPNVSIRGIETHENQLFVLTYSGIYLNGNKWMDEVNNGSANVFKMNDNIWLASTDQVFKLDLKTNLLTVLLDKNKSKEIGEISSVIVSEDKLFIGGFHGLFSINKAGKLINENIGKEVNNLTLLQDKLFVCTAMGIYHLENNIFKKNTKFPSGLVYNDIEERFGKFYAASTEGIWMSDEDSPLAKNILKNTPYENFECFSIECDEFYHLWTGTAKGLVKYDLNNDEIDVYLSDFEFNKRSSFKRESIFYFGTTEGLFSFDSKDFSMEEFSFQPKKELNEPINGWLLSFMLLALFSSLLSIYLFLKTKRKVKNIAPLFNNENEPVDNKPPFTMENIEVYILNNMSTITAESLREDSGMSKNLFYKAFSQYYDITPKQLIETIRRDHLRRKKNS